jgi:hypothetical protein
VNRSWPHRLLSLWLLAAGVAMSQVASAAEVTTQVSANVVGVGERFEVQLSVPLEDGDDPEDPRLPVDGPAQVHGPRMGTSRSITLNNFNFSSQTNLTLSWTVIATGKGRITLGPGSIRLGKKRLKGQPVTVMVTDEPPRRRRPRDPLDDFFSRDPFDVFRQRHREPEVPQAPAELQLESAPDAVGFLVAHLSKPSVVVGETITLTVYAYGSQGPYQEANPVEPSLADFLTFREVQSSFEAQRYQTTIGGRTFGVAKLRQIVLVPLTAGELQIGSMRAILHGQGYPEKGSPLGYSVESAPIKLRVHEAPKAGRPPEFLEGDVGNFSLKAELSPTTLTEGEYAELLVHISGQGNLPSRVPLPEGAGWQWQDPSTVGEPDVQNGELQGLRTIKIPVRLLTPGDVRLGKIRLAYFDPNAREYRWLESELPLVHVNARPESAAPAPQATSLDVKPAPLKRAAIDLEALLVPRGTMQEATDLTSPITKLWPASLLAPPISLSLFGAIYGIRQGTLRLRNRQKPRDTRVRVAKQALGELTLAERSHEQPSTKLVRRTLDAVLSAYFDKTSRALSATELTDLLASWGVSPETASGLVELKEALDRSEFAGVDDAGAHLPKVAPLLEQLLKKAGRRRAK